MLNFELISTLIGILGGTGILIGGAAYGYSAWRSGKNTYKDDNIRDLKETISIKDEIITRLNQEKSDLIAVHQKKIDTLQKEMIKMQIQLAEQSKQLKSYSELLENRDPTTLKILNEIRCGIETLNKHQVYQEANVKEVAVKAETVRTDLKAKKGVN